MSLGYLLDDIYLRHDPGPRHPESPRRLKAIRAALTVGNTLDQWHRIEPRPIPIEQLELIHHASLIEQVEKASRHAPARIEDDTGVSTDSFRTALFAAGGTLSCVDEICSGRIRRAFAFVRPPGHHAGPDRAMGFCLFNNVAIAAAYARLQYGHERVAVIDFDVHHGNGTQACFYDNPHVLFISSHQYPFYPGTGAFTEIGTREGKGFTVNFPLPSGAGDRVFVPVYSEIVAPILEQYRPQLILVSAGFDAHQDDPLGGLAVTTRGYGSVAASLILAADRLCHGKICFVLEGGYNTRALAECAVAVMQQMEARNPKEVHVKADQLCIDIFSRARKTFGSFWKL